MILPLEVAAVHCRISKNVAVGIAAGQTKRIEDCRYDIKLTRLRVEPDRELKLQQMTVPDVQVDCGEHSMESRTGDVMVNTDTPLRAPGLAAMCRDGFDISCGT